MSKVTTHKTRKSPTINQRIVSYMKTRKTPASNNEIVRGVTSRNPGLNESSVLRGIYFLEEQNVLSRQDKNNRVARVLNKAGLKR